ncbi:MAG: PilZ domain-containing protein [Betaproteobacteria bacterium]|nr:PilZ domain-containing protein [Betaproteobacteria bacterium]
METNRRRFSRIHFSTLAELSIGDEVCIAVKVLDLSLRGALVKTAGAPLPDFALGAASSLAIDLGEELTEGIPDEYPEGGILMNTVISHIHDDVIGLRCVEIDLDSLTNLRRIVEFNLGDEAMLSRELENLSRGE